jgi:hypothetical protein
VERISIEHNLIGKAHSPLRRKQSTDLKLPSHGHLKLPNFRVGVLVIHFWPLLSEAMRRSYNYYLTKRPILIPGAGFMNSALLAAFTKKHEEII